MNFIEGIITIGLVAIATMATRFLPFILFKSGMPEGSYLGYVGRAVPPAVFAMLVVYCFRSLSFTSPDGFLPEVIAAAVVIILHLSFRKTLLSVSVGTGLYILLVNLIFV